MNLVSMRAEFVNHTGGLGASLGSSEVDLLLNTFYRFVVPAEVDGDISELLWEPTTGTTASTLTLPGYIVALNRAKAWLFDTGKSAPIRLAQTNDLEKFINKYPDWNDGTVTGRPTAICIHGRIIYFNKRPDADYTMNFMCRGGDSAELTTAGLTDDIHALTVTAGAAWKYLTEREDMAGAAREGVNYDIYKNMLNTRSQSRFAGRRPARSF